MTNGNNESSSNDRALDAVNRPRESFFRPSIQSALGALMVVLVTTSFGLVFALRDDTRRNTEHIEDHENKAHAKHPVEWEDLDDLSDRLDQHEADGIRMHALIDQAIEHDRQAVEEMKRFMNKGGRYTRNDGDRDREYMKSNEARIRELELQMNRCRCGDLFNRNETIPNAGKHSHPVLKR